MLELIFIFGILLWFTIAVAVGFHAKGHNRSGIIWFTVVGITGIFGFAFYLLAVTSNSSVESKSGGELDRKIITKGPKFALTSVIGAIAVFFVGYVWAELSVGFNPELESLVSLVMLLSLVIGAISGPYVAFNSGLRRLGYLLSYTPVLVFGVMGGLASLNVVAGVSQTEFAIQHRAVLGIIGASFCGFLWFQLYQKMLQDGLQSVWQKSQAILSNRANRDRINLSRRKTLGFVGGGVSVLIGGIAYSYNPKPNLEIVETTVQHTSDNGVVNIVISNPRSEAVTIEIDAWVRVVEVQRTLTSHSNTYQTLLDKVINISANSRNKIELGYKPDDAFYLKEFELAGSDEPSLSVEDEGK